MIKLEIITIKEAIEEAGGNEQLFQEMADKFRQWLQQQLHLPQEISDEKLRCTILTAKFDLEKAKKYLDSQYTLRNLIPEFFADCDPLGESVARFHKCLYLFIIANIRAEEDTAIPEISIMDCTHLTLSHILKYSPTIMKKCDLSMQAYGKRYKAVYFINAPTYIEQLASIFKMVLKPKLFARLRFLTSGIESVCEDIPKSILPADYGGEEASMDTLTDMWRAKLMERREWLLAQEKLKTNESLRTDSVINPNDLFGVTGTFRKLEID
ncbi:PREDICTED: alpha-tocopherol transfer protein-like [Dinoponera quadriceps]|uniref:Alpha-tocopherol transfer protein-like n=1 Tax=Dinoponera quadriceps TaxID=609295 RepID=A0A6P3XYQ8_DINQU|nr:PREDICTED: alpha-tocopherol transfer protein-like [Dinoponera quadriceps]